MKAVLSLFRLSDDWNMYSHKNLSEDLCQTNRSISSGVIPAGIGWQLGSYFDRSSLQKLVHLLTHFIQIDATLQTMVALLIAVLVRWSQACTRVANRKSSVDIRFGEHMFVTNGSGFKSYAFGQRWDAAVNHQLNDKGSDQKWSKGSHFNPWFQKFVTLRAIVSTILIEIIRHELKWGPKTALVLRSKRITI